MSSELIRRKVRTWYLNISWKDLCLNFFMIFAGLFSVFRYLRAQDGSIGLRKDPQEVWLPIGRRILQGDHIYVGSDPLVNKPPLFQYFNAAAVWTGDYWLAMYLAAGVIKMYLLYKTYQIFADIDKGIGIVATGVLFYHIIKIGGFIQNETFAIAFLILAVNYVRNQSHLFAGLSLGIAGMCSQFVIFALPALVWIMSDRKDEIFREFVRLVLGAGFVVVFSYSSLLAWGIPEFVEGIKRTILVVGPYATEYPDGKQSIVANYASWLADFMTLIMSFEFIFILCIVGGSIAIVNGIPRPAKDYTLVGIALMPTFLIRARSQYIILTMMSFSILVAFSGYPLSRYLKNSHTVRDKE